MKRSPLSRGDKSLTRKSLPRGKGRLKPKSDRKVEEDKITKPWRAKFLEENPWCRVWWDSGCTRKAIELHEIYTRARAGGTMENLIDPANVVPVCRYCHTKIDDHKLEATHRGWLLTSPPNPANME